ncbi:MAG TPA: peptidoglycan-binding protein [Miltoncostaeaceae bacterium]|nr:peptidoglycan-binding protein [Miltoncostaeaceae bacterium]
MAPCGVRRAALAAIVLAAVFAGRTPDRAPAAPAPSPGAEAGVLTVGSTGPTVRALQRKLRSRGFRVRVDGAYGRGTRRAVIRFQRRLGLRVNGIVDRPLLWWLGLSVCRLPGPTTARGGRGGVLRLGAYGPQVCSLQRALVRGGEKIAVDGGYGPQTRGAVRRAQRRLGLRPTGVADRRLRARLRSGARRVRVPPGALAIGAEGGRVRRLQTALRRQGFTVAIDGAFGPRTRLAVARFQRKQGTPVNGVADLGLQRRLDVSTARHLLVFPVDGVHSFTDDFTSPRATGPHHAIDIIAPRGAPVVAVRGGVIDRLSRADTGLGGIRLWLRDEVGTTYYYAHLLTIAPGLAPGSPVVAGQRLGAVGRTGNARGGVFHLHFEMHPGGGAPVNPYRELRDVDPTPRV